MAWKNNLFDASFRGVKFEVQNVSRAGSRAIAVNEYPYSAGAELDDLNLKARHIKVRAIIWGDNYEADLKRLVEALEAPGVGELVHPVHGTVKVMAESWEDEHEADLVDGAMLSISFIEHSVREVIFSASSASAKTDAVSAKAADARGAADDALVRRVEQAQDSPLRRLSVLKDTLNQAKGSLQKLLDTTGLRAVLSDLDPVLFPRAYVADMAAVVDRALQGLPFGGRNLLFDPSGGAKVSAGSGLTDFNTAASQLDPAAVALTPSAAAPDADMQADTAAVQAHARVHAACALADCVVIVLAAELDLALLDRADIEALVNRVRKALQAAIDAARAALDAEGRGQVSTALRALAFAVQDAGLAVINQRPPLVRKACPVNGPVRLVAHQLYGDAARASEISRLNGLGRRVFIERGEVLNVYAV